MAPDGKQYCKHCGTIIDADCVVCPTCGLKLTGTSLDESLGRYLTLRYKVQVASAIIGVVVLIVGLGIVLFAFVNMYGSIQIPTFSIEKNAGYEQGITIEYPDGTTKEGGFVTTPDGGVYHT